MRAGPVTMALPALMMAQCPAAAAYPVRAALVRLPVAISS